MEDVQKAARHATGEMGVTQFIFWCVYGSLSAPSDLYFQAYCLIKEETLSGKGYLMPQLDSPHETAEFKRPGLLEQSGLGTKRYLNLRPFTFLTLCRIQIKRIRLTMRTGI